MAPPVRERFGNIAQATIRTYGLCTRTGDCRDCSRKSPFWHVCFSPVHTSRARLIMSKTPSLQTPRSVLAASAAAGAALAVVLAVLGGRAISAQDKYTAQTPNGLASPSSGGTKTGRLSPSVTPKTPQ
jgi:hypothetical protein